MDTTFDKAAWVEQKKAQRQAVYDQIETYLDNLPLEEPLFRQYLTVQSRFPRCSVNNAILIATQKPEATQCKTYEDWNKAGFSVLKGQQSFSLLVPNGTYAKADGSTGTNFHVQKVFDISQTSAQPQPDTQDISENLKALLLRPVCPVKVVEQQKYNILKHPNVMLSTDGGSKPYIHGGATSAVASITLTVSAFASDPITVVNNLSTFIFGLILAVGIILVGWGVVQVGLSIQSHDASQRSQGFLTLAGGIVIFFAQEILTLIGVS